MATLCVEPKKQPTQLRYNIAQRSASLSTNASSLPSPTHSTFSSHSSRSATMPSDPAAAAMHHHSNDSFKLFFNRVIRRTKKEPKRAVEISAPYNFQKCNLDIAGISADEIAMLKEQAVASRIGIVEFDSANHSPSHSARPSVSQPVRSSASFSTIRTSYSL